MSREPRSDADLLPDRDEQCPERGIGLTHIQDGTAECVYCGQAVRTRRRKVAKDPDFTDKQIKDMEFLRWLRRQGRI